MSKFKSMHRKESYYANFYKLRLFIRTKIYKHIIKYDYISYVIEYQKEGDNLKKVKIEDMKVSVSFGEASINSDIFYSILSKVIRRLEEGEKTNEKKCSIA